MGSPAKKKLRPSEQECEDRISRLPDDLIHKILSYADAKEAVQTSVLSKRWKLIWTTLPFLSFCRYDDPFSFDDVSRYTMFIRHVLSNRNHQSHVSELKMLVPEKLSVKSSVSKKKFRGCVVQKFIEYAISHSVQELNIALVYKHKPYKLSTFNSRSLKKLELNLKFEDTAAESDSWDLPCLTTLHLIRPLCHVDQTLSESCLTCLPALRTLRFYFYDLSNSSIVLPDLTTLHLLGGKLPRKVWDLPSLLSLDLDVHCLPKNMSDMFSTLVNLQNLTISLSSESIKQDHFISCPQLLNLNISTRCFDPPYGNIMVSAPKLCNFSSSGIFSIMFGVPELENVDIKLRDWFHCTTSRFRKQHSQRFTSMLSGLGNAKNLSFDLKSIEVLSEISNFLASFSSPFCNLKCVKLPKEYEDTSMPSTLRSYLLGGSPRAIIVTSLPQKNRIPQTPALPVAAKNAVLQEPLKAPTKELGDYQYIDKIPSVDNADMGVQEQYVVVDSLVDTGRVRQIDALVEGASNDRVSSSKGNRDFGLWRGHEVNSEFVCLLDRIMHKYPETFEHFTMKNKNLCTVRLNMLCTSLNEFAKISMSKVDSEIIVEYRNIFAYLQNLGFNVSWAVSRLNYIDHLWFSGPLIPELHAIDCRINDDKSKLQDLQARVDDAKSKLQDLQSRVDDAKTKLKDVQTLRVEKMAEIQNAFGTLGTTLADGLFGDDLLSGP